MKKLKVEAPFKGRDSKRRLFRRRERSEATSTKSMNSVRGYTEQQSTPELKP
jgi:hypothetical protein